jgi:hypothetical protein
MKPTHSPERVAPLSDQDAESLDALVTTSRQLGRFWPPVAHGPEPKAAATARVSVPARTQRLVAGMPDYGG